MAKDEPTGLISRMVRLVRPGAGWTGDEGADESDPDSGLGRQALKEMIERRRRNDFVREREFDQLRKLRRAGSNPAPGIEIAPISVLDSTLASRPHDREVTLRKIDEIEEQMSRQWWKAKPGSGGPPSGNGRVDGAPVPSAARPTAGGGGGPLPRPGAQAADYDAPAAPVRSFATTAIDVAPPPETQPAAASPDLELPDAAAREGAAANDPAAERARKELIDAVSADFPDYQHDPVIEEAAIRFANGDSPGAEQALQALLASTQAEGQQEWWAAVFDFYRAVGRHDRYEAVAIDFAQRFGRSPPAWFSLAVDEVLPLGVEPGSGMRWYSPERLDGAGVAALVARTEAGPTPWLLDWSALRSLQDDAAAPLLAAFSSWSEQPVALRLSDIDCLSDCLRERTPEGDAEVAPDWWRLRMELLRLLKLPDDFERIAMGYCITYEVSPPSWQPPRCDCSVVRPGEYAPPDAPASEFGPPSDFAISASLASSEFLAASPLANRWIALGSRGTVVAATLSGELVGGAEDALVALDRAVEPAPGALVIDCGRLARIDFGAAGSLLNWVATHHGDGLHIQFRDLHRMVAAFFTVIGIHEYARLHVRID